MKEEILNYLKTDRTFAKGVELYHKYGKNKAFQKTLNLQPESPWLTGLLHEQLHVLAGISHKEYEAIMRVPLVIAAKVIEKAEPKVPNYQAIPENVRKTIRLRDDFPFLKEKDCPEELKILVADMLSAYDNYCKAHEELFNANGEEEFAKISAAVVENYLENRAIWDELQYYKANGKYLAKHPIFNRKEIAKKVAKMNAKQLVTRNTVLENEIGKTQASITKGDKPHLNASREASILLKQTELIEVKKALNINESV